MTFPTTEINNEFPNWIQIWSQHKLLPQIRDLIIFQLVSSITGPNSNFLHRYHQDHCTEEGSMTSNVALDNPNTSNSYE